MVDGEERWWWIAGPERWWAGSESQAWGVLGDERVDLIADFGWEVEERCFRA